MLRRFSIRRRRPTLKTFNVVALDGATLSFNLDSRSIGKDLLDKVLQECAITSPDMLHFGLASQEENYLRWILLNKPLKKQLSGHSPYTLVFRVHIYPYNHHSLIQSLTRHYLYLQVKQDLKQNRLQPSSSTAMTHITSLVVQGEIGNYIPHTCSNGYIKELQILPALTTGMEEAIKQAHRLNRGRLPGECEEEVLDLVQDEPTYGSVYYGIQDSHRQPITVCVCPVGVRVAQGGRQINCFKWESITKVTSRGKHVYLQLDVSQTLSSSDQVRYICPNSAVAATITNWCQTLLNFYCSIEQEEEVATQSKLKRFFSTRRSLRRSNQLRRQALTYPSSIPVQRRRGSAEVTMLSSTVSNGSPRQANKGLTKREDSKLVIYGLSGLANSQDDTEQVTLANGLSEHGSSAPLEVSDTVNSPDDQVHSSSNLQESVENALPVIEEEYDTLDRREGLRDDHGSPTKREGFGGVPRGDRTPPKRREGDRTPPNKRFGGDRSPPKRREGFGGDRTPPTRREGFEAPPIRREGFEGDCTPPTRREGYTSRDRYHGSPTRRNFSGDHGSPTTTKNFGGGGSPIRRSFVGDQHSSPTRREDGFRVTHVPLTDREENRPTGRLSGGLGGVTGSMPSLKREVRRDGGGYEGYGRQRGDRQHWNSPPVQGSVGDVEHKSISSLLQQRHVPAPPLPPRTFSETEIPMEGRGYEYSTEHRANHAPNHLHYHRRGPSGSKHSGGGVSPSSHYIGHRERLSSNQSPPQRYSSPSSPSPYPSTPSPCPPQEPHLSQGLPHHRSQPYYPRHSYGGSSQYSYQSQHRGGRSQNEIKSHSPHHPRSRQENNPSPQPNSYHQLPHYSPSNSSGHSTRCSYQSRGDDPHSKPNYWHQNSSGRPSPRGGEELYNSYQDDVVVNGNPTEYSAMLKKRHSTSGIREGDARYSLRAYRRRGSHGDTMASENWWDYRQGDAGYSPAASSGGGGDRKHFKYPANPGGRNPQAWKGGQRPANGTWPEEEDTVSHTSSSLPLHSNPEYSLYEEDEEMGEERGSQHLAARPRVYESGRHVSRHKRLRHSTTTSLTSLPDISGGMSRLGSIASLDYQASFAELSQADSISGYIDPHVRSLVFEASQNSQGTEL